MSRRVRVFQVDAFTREPFLGNPAGVVLEAEGLSESQMQRLARELNNSETAFLFPPTGSDHDVGIRYFTPTIEVPSCGHATLAAHYVRAREMGLPGPTESCCTVRQKSAIGILPIEVRRTHGELGVVMTQGKVEISRPLERSLRDEVLEALGIAREEIREDCPIQVVSTGHGKLMVGLRSNPALQDLAPDLGALERLSAWVGANGYFVFTLDVEEEGYLSEARMFAPAIGIAEDPVTGNGNGPLGAYLVHHQIVEATEDRFAFTGLQGRALGRLGRVKVEVDVQGGEPVAVRVGDEAVVVFETEIDV
jgi:PhzF family phenazine biosynthesis protein